jgi:hypothetical protein
MYRVTPQTTTGLAPAELLFNRKVRTRLDLVHPSVERRVVQKQSQQKLNHDHAEVRSYQVGDLVSIKNFSVGPKWLAGVVAQITGPLSYVVKLTDGRLLKRHVDHVLPRVQEDLRGVSQNQPPLMLEPPLVTKQPLMAEDPRLQSEAFPASSPEGAAVELEEFQQPDPGNADPEDRTQPATSAAPIASPAGFPEGRPVRQRRLPERFKDYVLKWFQDVRK